MPWGTPTGHTTPKYHWWHHGQILRNFQQSDLKTKSVLGNTSFVFAGVPNTTQWKNSHYLYKWIKLSSIVVKFDKVILKIPVHVFFYLCRSTHTYRYYPKANYRINRHRKVFNFNHKFKVIISFMSCFYYICFFVGSTSFKGCENEWLKYNPQRKKKISLTF